MSMGTTSQRASSSLNIRLATYPAAPVSTTRRFAITFPPRSFIGSPRTAGTPAPRNPNGRTATSFAAEDGLALLQHRAAALARVLTAPRRLDERVDIVVRDRLARRERPLDEGLDAGQRERRVLADGARELRRRGVEVRRRHDLVHHPDLARAPRLDRPPRRPQVPRVRGRAALDQRLGVREDGHQAQALQRHAEAGRRGRRPRSGSRRTWGEWYHPGADQGKRMKHIYEVKDRIARITINRPEAMNAMDADVYAELSRAWIDVRDNPEVWIAIVTGAGDKAFTAGADLKSFIPGTRGKADFWLTQKNMILNRGLEVWKPIIAAVNGYCLAGGMTLLFATDVRIAAEHAVFEISEVKRGILPGNGGTQRALRQLPYAIAMEMLLLGRRLTAPEALGYGLVNRVVPMKDLMATADEYARRLCDNGPLALRAVKELAIRSQSVPLEHGLRLEESFQEFLRTTEDAKEGPRAFAEKRKAAYKAQ